MMLNGYNTVSQKLTSYQDENNQLVKMVALELDQNSHRLLCDSELNLFQSSLSLHLPQQHSV